MKILIAVLSYDGDAVNGSHQVIRETWGKDVITWADFRFFIGRRGVEFEPKRDEVVIPWQQFRPCQHPWYSSVEGCCEDYWQFQTKEMIRWALNNNYDYIFLCENDTFLIPRKLFNSGFENFDFSGEFVPKDVPLGKRSSYDIYGHRLYSWPDPGVGYFLSEKAMRLILNAPKDHWSVGMYAGQVIGPHIERQEATAMNFPEGTSWHYRLVKGKGYTMPIVEGHSWMREMYAKS